MPRYNFLDEAGLKQYHKLAGYSEMPITDITTPWTGKLNTDGSIDYSNLSYKVTDYIELRKDIKFIILYPAMGSTNIICYYDDNGNFLSRETFIKSISFVLNDKISNGVIPTKIKISYGVVATPTIRTLHKDATRYLYDKINTEITETNNTIVRLHATYGISATSTTYNPFEIGVSTPITISGAYFKFDNANVTPSGGYKITRSGNAGSKTLFSGSSGGILNTGGSITDTITNSATYTISITHLGGTFTKSASVSAYYPMYFGSSAKESIVASDLNSIISKVTNNPTNNGTDKIAVAVDGVGVFTKQKIWNSPTGAHAFKVNNDEFVYLLVPSTMSISLEGVKSGGFKVPLSPTVNTITSTNKGSYKVYRSNSTFNGGILNITIES